jgi:guanylate kinase
MANSIKKNKKRKTVLVIGGPSGVGESTITKKIIERFPIFKRLVTATTRKPRLGEKNRVDYYFFSKNKFLAEIKKGNIIEYTYIKNRDVYYGSYKPDLGKKLRQGYKVIVNPDIVGARYYKKHYQATTIFLKPDSMANLKKRQLARNPGISSDELKKRLIYAREEIKKEAPFYDYIVINRQGEMGKTIGNIIKILKKEGYGIR